MSKQGKTGWRPPRGIRLVTFADRPSPYGVQWRVNGARKTKTFETIERQVTFAKSLAGEVRQNGLAAFRLDEGEAREWRAFRAMIGPEADLAAVAACWERHKAEALPTMTVTEAVEAYCTAKKAEGLPESTLAHFGPIFDRLTAALGEKDIARVTAADVADFMAAQAGSEHTIRTRFARSRALFNWLLETRRLAASPFAGMRPPKVSAKEVEILTVEQTRRLFERNAADEDGIAVSDERRELLGRLALEAFAGLRNDTAAQIVAAEIQPDGLRIPAAKIKTRQNQFLDGLPANLHAWLAWSRPDGWCMTPRQYLQAKTLAFARAGVPHPRNCLRKGFASYHVAAFKDPSRTSVIMCHTSPKMLWDTYRGIATQDDGKAYFEILP